MPPSKLDSIYRRMLITRFFEKGWGTPENLQRRSNLQNVSDIFVMGGCLILECLVLLHWCERNGLGPLGITGLSMGGHMASLAATNWPKPLVLVPCLSWSTAAPVFTTGVMSQSINWDMLETQYHSDGKYSERLSKMVTVVDDAFAAGQKFIKNFNQSLQALKTDISDTRHVQKQSSDAISNNYIEVESNQNQLENNNSIFLKENKAKNVISTASSLQVVNKEKSSAVLKKEDDESALTKLMKYILPMAAQSDNKKIDITKTNWWEREALQFMRGMMDECTHLKNFSVPFDTSLIIAVCAKDDAYVPREGCASLEEIWPGVEVRYLDAGHVSAYVLHQKLFRKCIIEAFERSKQINIMDKGNIGEDLKPTLTYKELVNKYTNSI
ncbi:protein ABHD18 isoform X4 [Zeugodacus cucurbitae]|uniref:protein ABHD18 isoform X4 n=1 Tax=Zeugodacus cucurbitae TaxID=28588 RepID=UPI0023D9612F|nr:protein ABHD18 isoform X4 [Zeugodacus cucurbitae]